MSETLYIRKTNNPDGPYATTQYVPVEPVLEMLFCLDHHTADTMDHERCEGLTTIQGYRRVDDRAKRRAAANEVSRLGMAQEAMEANGE